MRRYTTPTHVFSVGIDLTNATALYITYQQDGQVVVEKTIEDVTIVDAETISVNLTQEETGAFKQSYGDANRVFIQIRAAFADGSSATSEIVSTFVDGVLKEGEI